MLEGGHGVIGYDNVNDYYDPSLKEARIKILEDYAKFTFFRNDLLDEEILAKMYKDYNPVKGNKEKRRKVEKELSESLRKQGHAVHYG